jgi:hypothetical protein
MAKTISIEFDGCWRDVNKGSIPAQSGIYCVYECTYNVQEKTVSLQRLIYIGESGDVQGRLANHEKYQDWLKYVRQGNTLCFSFGPVGTVDRERAEAALIFKHKPPENTEHRDNFLYDQTTMAISGKTALLIPNFTIDRTE